MHPPLYVTPAGRIAPHQRQAAVIALYEHMVRVSLVAPLPTLDVRGR